MEKQDKVKITRLTIKIGGKSVSVTMEEARKLKEAMDEIFPAQLEPIQIHWHHEPYHMPALPYSPQWTFCDTALGGDGSNTCSATLNIAPEGNIIT